MVSNIVMYASVTIACLIAVLNIIAPLTKTDWDNKALSALRWFEDTVMKILIPKFRKDPAPAGDAAPAA